MSIHQSFISASPEKYTYEWSSFVREIPTILMNDRKLKRLFFKYPFFEEKREEILIEFTDEIHDELEYWVYYLDGNQYNELDFYNLLYETVNIAFKELLAKYVPINMQQISDINQGSLVTVDDIKKFEDEIDDFEKFEENEIQSIELSEIRNAEWDFSIFEFDKKRLFKIFREWDSPSIIRPTKQIVKKIPLIKTISYFDPTIYDVIKKNPELLKSMDWRLFEEMLADILRRFKYSVELTQPTKDGGIDIIAIKKDENFGDHKYLLQAKRYNDAVQVSPVRELLFLHNEYNATKSCLATTATFTSGAWKLADKYKWKMELKDQQGILSWINKVTTI